MLCEKCGKNQATTLIKQTVNGNVTQLRLCAHCAEEMGFGLLSGFEPFGGISFNDILGSLFSQELPQQTASQADICSFCGSTFEDFMKSARAGCANCYKEFYDRLLPSVQRIHGKTRHVGKIPASAEGGLRARRQLETLRRQLEQAVAAQEYEKAAVLRDQIKSLEGQVQE